MVERSLSMREVPGSIPGASIILVLFFNQVYLKNADNVAERKKFRVFSELLYL